MTEPSGESRRALAVPIDVADEHQVFAAAQQVESELARSTCG
ncbi:MAG: hypothetical protein ACYC1E_05145 [Propionibacteriaceae bacterium]